MFPGKESLLSSSKKQQLNNIRISPNPVCQTIEIIGIDNEYKYSIYNSQGILLQNGINNRGKKINVNTLVNGVYILNTYYKNDEIIKTFIFIKN